MSSCVNILMFHLGFAKIVVTLGLNFKCKTANFNYAFILLTETCYSSNILDSELCLDNYTVYRFDKNNLTNTRSRGGGIISAVFFLQIIPITNLNIEQLYIHFNYNNEKFIIGGVYSVLVLQFNLMIHILMKLIIYLVDIEISFTFGDDFNFFFFFY